MPDIITFWKKKNKKLCHALESSESICDWRKSASPTLPLRWPPLVCVHPGTCEYELGIFQPRLDREGAGWCLLGSDVDICSCEAFPFQRSVTALGRGRGAFSTVDPTWGETLMSHRDTAVN